MNVKLLNMYAENYLKLKVFYRWGNKKSEGEGGEEDKFLIV